MRFIANYARYTVVIQRDIPEVYGSGLVKVVQEGIYAHFEPGGLTEAERELALRTLPLSRGSYQQIDEATPVQPDFRLSVHDTRMHNWTDEVREMVEHELLRLCDIHQGGTGDIVAVPEIRLAPPWPNYDSFAGTPAALMRKLVEDGYVLADVLAYERENQNRDKVIEGLEELIANPTGEREMEEVLG